jgi:hypothetical protein
VNWVQTNGRKPRTGDKLLLLKFRNGLESKKGYTANQIRWSQVGDPWDVIEVARV